MLTPGGLDLRLILDHVAFTRGSDIMMLMSQILEEFFIVVCIVCVVSSDCTCKNGSQNENISTL